MGFRLICQAFAPGLFLLLPYYQGIIPKYLFCYKVQGCFILCGSSALGEKSVLVDFSGQSDILNIVNKGVNA